MKNTSKCYFLFFLFLVTLNSTLKIEYCEAQWVQLSTNTTEALYDIYFLNVSTGIAVGSNGKIIRTSNGGQSWSSINSGTANSLYTLDFPENMIGYTGGYTGTVLRTLDGGSSWNPRTGCGINIQSISFLNVNTGITAGGGNLMCYTTDGGQSWNPRYIPFFAVSGVTFINSTTLLVSATDLPGAVIYKSTNSGYNWTAVLTLNNSGLDIMYTLSYIYFKNPVTGFCTGNRNFYGQVTGNIYRTTNSGENWNVTGSIGPAPGSALFGVHFADSNIGFVAGNNGVIMRTNNAGTNWFIQTSGITSQLKAVYMLDAQTGYVCGSNGIVLKTTNGGITGFIKSDNKIPDKFYLFQNYPNPFNPISKIKFQIAKFSFAILKVYDVLGKEVAALVNEQLKPGTYEVEFNASDLPSGVYYYRLSSESFTQTKKILLIK